ncbi:SusC/RagA family TonB-linked outer membrane protein [Pedobacter petrophilus]|uniref:SusC/RagA family TonB-linked outer membrane protein n=2 Tax=Pedobacter petrophilus TaxID=1908241 RepID=A0A7K0FSB5_9SPHI|nr:SusC/RagA family TonB-linked outer membrane protein [Pedobacter petrophilus]
MFLVTAILTGIYGGNLNAQTPKVAVTGRVSDNKGIPIPSVTVKENGTTNVTMSNNDGSYKITAAKGSTLAFAFIGYATKSVTVGDQPQINITLVDDAEQALEDVVVVGFGKQKKVNLTGSVGVVDAKSLENRPVQNLSQALQGLVPGLNISQNNGSLESRPTINIRGVGTIGSSSSDPLVLIDGMEGSLNALNPQDVESISVLKDASASSIYGSRAAFGVILVTTKRGKAGRVQVNYNNSFRQTSPVLLPEMMDSYTFALYFNDAGINGGSAPHFDAASLKRIKDFQDGTLKSTIIPSPNNNLVWADGYAFGNDNNDWYKVMYRDHSFSQEHNVSLTGGTEATSYYLSGNFMDQTGMMRFNQDGYARYGATAKINTKISEFLTANYSNRFLRETYHRPAALTTGFYEGIGRQGWPTLPLYDPNGYLYSSPSPALEMAEGGDDNEVKDWMYQQIQLVFEPIKGWKTFGEANYRTQTQFRHWDSQQTFNHDVNGVPYLYRRSSNVNEYGYKENYFNTNIYSEYSKSYGKHNLKIMAGFQYEDTRYRDLNAQRNGVIVADIPTLNTTSGLDADGKVLAPTVSGQYQNWATQGLFSRLNYDYDGIYLLEANLRYDGSSRFRSDKRWGWFPSVSAGWNMAREEFFKDKFSFVNTFKFRASYGSLGNQNTKVWYPTYLTMPIGTASGTWLINGGRPNTASAPGIVSSTLTWETVESYNAGLDFGFLKNRLTGSFDWFNRKTLNMVGPAPELPVTLGTGVPSTNNTDLKSVGFEFEIGWNDLTKSGLGYGVKFLLSDLKTTVTRYPNATMSLDIYRTGQQLGDIWGYTTIGIAKTQEEMNAHLATLSNGQSAFGSQWSAGDIMYADYNKDGKLDWGSWRQGDSGDAHLIGNSTPRYRVGLDINMDYKGFDFRAFFQGVLKRDFWQGSYFFWGATSDKWWSTGLVQHTDYFRNDPNSPLGLNLDSYYPRPTFGTGKNQQTQTGYLQDASYIRLKNIQLGYTIPQRLTKKFGAQKLRVFASGENLVTWTKLAEMFDPETIDGGSNGSVYPLSKVMSLGLSVTF